MLLKKGLNIHIKDVEFTPCVSFPSQFWQPSFSAALSPSYHEYQKKSEVTTGCDAQGIMSDGSWELSGGSEGRRNYSLWSSSSFSSGLGNTGTGEPVKLQTHQILQQGPSPEPAAEEELLTCEKGEGSLPCSTHREQLLVFPHTWGNVCPAQNNIHRAFPSERRKKFRAVKDDFCISDL